MASARIDFLQSPGSDKVLRFSLGISDPQPMDFTLVPIKIVTGAGMKGFRRFLSYVSSTQMCHIAFSMNANLHTNSNLRDIFKKQPDLIRDSKALVDKMLPQVTGCPPEKMQSTFVLDMCKDNVYEDRECIRRFEDHVAEFLRKPPPTGSSKTEESHRLIRPWTKFLIAEGIVKCELVQAMSPEQRNWMQGTQEGKLMLCQLGLLAIHCLQYGFELQHKPSGTWIRAASVFKDLEPGEPCVRDDALEQLCRYSVMTVFPGTYYAEAYSHDAPYFEALWRVSEVQFAAYGGAAEVATWMLPASPTVARRCKIDYAATEPSTVGVVRGLCHAVEPDGLELPGGHTPLSRKAPSDSSEEFSFEQSTAASDGARSRAVRSAYSPAETIFGGSLRPSSLTLDEKVTHVQLVCSNGGELVGLEDLRALFQEKEHPVCYDGFEPSGRMHIAQGVLKALNVNRLTKAGCVFVFWVADWFGLLNNKMGGDLEKIQTVGRYFVEVWKASGMDMQNVRFLWAAEEINKNSDRYWLMVMSIARSSNISRMKRCAQIMGRQDGDDQPAANIIYPCMQCADVFYLGADICQLGMDQRKVNMLAREFLDKPECKEVRRKPIVASHGMIPGLLPGQEKMSKSDPDSAIFMEDSVEDVQRKVHQAYCPPRELEGNPCIAYVRTLVFPKDGQFVVHRDAKRGGDMTYMSPDEFEAAYARGDVHPGDLKPSLAAAINTMIEPVREHFRQNTEAAQLLETVCRYRVTR